MLVDNVFWGSLDTYAATPGELAVTIPLARLGLHVVEIRNRPERNTACVPASSTSFKLEFKQLETAYDGHAIDYSYDDLSRLLAADYFAAWDAVNPVREYDFSYDLAGNRTSEVVNVDGAPFSSQSHTYDAANRISSAGFAYNDAGQMTADGTNTYSWDRAGRLLGSGDSSYAYNGLGQRVQQTVSGVVTDYLLDVQPGLAKVIAAMTGANTERFVHERGLLSQQDSVGDWTWMVKDGLGSVRGVIDDGFDAVASRHFAPYGVSYDEQGSFTVPFAFTGEMLDANGLQYHRARYYNPALGAFPSLDPVEGVLQQAMSLNRYAYVAGNVMNAVDPSGAYPCSNNPAISGACEELRIAILRAATAGVMPMDIGSILQRISQVNLVQGREHVTYRMFERNFEKVFGTQFRLYNSSAFDNLPVDLDDCTNAPQQIQTVSGDSYYVAAIRSLLRTTSALVHIVARLGEDGRSTAIQDFRNSVGNQLQFDFVANGAPSAEGYTVQPGTGHHAGHGLLRLGSHVTVATIVHEIGHAFEDSGATPQAVRNIMAGPEIIISGDIMKGDYLDNFTPDELGLAADRRSINHTEWDGMMARANPSSTAGEVWADMFMTWVLHGHYVMASSDYWGSIASPYEISDDWGPTVGWDCTYDIDKAQANFKYTFTRHVVNQLIDTGTLSSDIVQIVNRDTWEGNSENLPCPTDY